MFGRFARERSWFKSVFFWGELILLQFALGQPKPRMKPTQLSPRCPGLARAAPLPGAASSPPRSRGSGPTARAGGSGRSARERPSGTCRRAKLPRHPTKRGCLTQKVTFLFFLFFIFRKVGLDSSGVLTRKAKPRLPFSGLARRPKRRVGQFRHRTRCDNSR